MKKDILQTDMLQHIVLDLQQMKTFCERPLVIEKAKGICLWDVNGKRYIDGLSGIYVVNIGHGNEYVLEAMRRQMEKVNFAPPLHAVADISVRYAARLAELTPGDLNTIKLLSGGSEATEAAMKFARQYHKQNRNPRKYKVISCYKSFHGATLGAMSASGLGGPRRSVFEPLLTGFEHVMPPTCYRCVYEKTYPECNSFCARILEEVIKNEGPESVAAFIIEPIGNTGGIVSPPDGYLPVVREICTRYDVLLIFDEMITGFGRTGEWFAAQTFKTTPDILCMGKGMGGGYVPLAGVAISDRLYFGAFWGEEEQDIHFAHGHTFGANPICAAAGLACLDVIERDKLIENGRRIGDYLRHRLTKEVGALGILGDIRGAGCLLGVEFVRDPATKEPFKRQFGKRVQRRLIEKGLILRCDPDWIAFAPPLITTETEAEEIVGIFLEAVREELAQGEHACSLSGTTTAP
jgi:adenosylmethionine-8-amino-7-oxononanoate aminotransferase